MSHVQSGFCKIYESKEKVEGKKGWKVNGAILLHRLNLLLEIVNSCLNIFVYKLICAECLKLYNLSGMENY